MDIVVSQKIHNQTHVWTLHVAHQLSHSLSTVAIITLAQHLTMFYVLFL